MSVIAELPGVSRILLYILLTLIALITAIVFAAQIGFVRGKPFENPDGTGLLDLDLCALQGCFWQLGPR